MFPNIKLNGGGDLTLPTLNGNLIRVSDVPNINVPIYQYESTFKTLRSEPCLKKLFSKTSLPII